MKFVTTAYIIVRPSYDMNAWTDQSVSPKPSFAASLLSGSWRGQNRYFYCHTKPMPATAAAKSLQSCPTLCDPIDSRPPGFPIPGILQARTLEWVAVSFSNAWKWKLKVKSLSRVSLWPHGLQPTGLLRPWDFPGKSTGVGCHCLLRTYA